MAKQKFTVTDTYQLIATTPVLIEIFTKGSGPLLFNDVNSDDDFAYQRNGEPGDQYEETATRDSYVRAKNYDSSRPWVLLVDDGV